MLHVILFLLKIIGIFLAALLGLLLLILLLLLFVPVRYRGRLQKEGELAVRTRVSWFLHVVSVPISFQKGVLSVKIKLFGITVKNLTEDEEEIRRDTKELSRRTKDAAKEEEEQIEKAEGAGMEPKANLAEEVRERPEPEDGEHPPKEEEAADEDAGDPWEEEPDKNEDEKESRIKRILQKIKAFFRKLFSFWEKMKNLKYTFRRFCDKIKRGIKKYQGTKEFLQDERTRKALGHAWKEVKHLIGRLLPKKIRGELHFGTQDPALTGEILGGISIFYPIFMDNVKVYPNFEQSILEGDLSVKGSFRAVTAALILWRLWRDKNVRYVYRRFTGGRG